MEMNFEKNIESIKRITLVLSILSLTVLYVLLFGNITRKNNLNFTTNKRDTLIALKTQTDSIFSEIKMFYNGPSNDKKYNFASYIYATNIGEFELNSTLTNFDLYELTLEDKDFLIAKSNSIRNNLHGFKSILNGLIDQKNNRVPFDDLTLTDLTDLDYHKGKDTWRIQREVYFLNQALSNHKSHKKPFLAHTKTLENTYKYLWNQYEKGSKSPQTIPLKAGRTKEVTDLLEKLNEKGYNSIRELKADISNSISTIEEIQKEINTPITIPVIDLSIESGSLSWGVSLSNTIMLMFLIFYLGKVNSSFKTVTKNRADIKDSLTSYPWVFINDQSLSNNAKPIRWCLNYLLLSLPVITGITSIILAKNMSFTEWCLSILLFCSSIWFTILTYKEIKNINLEIQNS